MYSSPISVPAEIGSSAGAPPMVPANDDHEDDDAPTDVVPAAEAERPKGMFGRLIDMLCTPGESNFDNP